MQNWGHPDITWEAYFIKTQGASSIIVPCQARIHVLLYLTAAAAAAVVSYNDPSSLLHTSGRSS